MGIVPLSDLLIALWTGGGFPDGLQEKLHPGMGGCVAGTCKGGGARDGFLVLRATQVS